MRFREVFRSDGMVWTYIGGRQIQNPYKYVSTCSYMLVSLPNRRFEFVLYNCVPTWTLQARYCFPTLAVFPSSTLPQEKTLNRPQFCLSTYKFLGPPLTWAGEIVDDASFKSTA